MSHFLVTLFQVFCALLFQQKTDVAFYTMFNPFLMKCKAVQLSPYMNSSGITIPSYFVPGLVHCF